MKNKSIKNIVKEIEKHKNAISLHRDKLREIHQELETCIQSFDSGIETLEMSLDYLSEKI